MKKANNYTTAKRARTPKRKRAANPETYTTYRGERAGYASLWMGVDDEDRANCPDTSRIRVIHSQEVRNWMTGLSRYSYDTIYCINNPVDEYTYLPCWVKRGSTVAANIKAMKTYDKGCGLKTLFLGYVRDAE